MSDVSLLDLFREEVRSHTATLSQGLLELEEEAGNPRRIEPLMRAAHSLKGAARIADLHPPEVERSHPPEVERSREASMSGHPRHEPGSRSPLQ